MQVVTVNKSTGEIEPNCAICGHGVACGLYEYPDGVHVMIEVKDEEYSAILDSIKEREDGNPEITIKLDMKKAKAKLEDRAQVDVPIEMDGIGGKEIIGYEQKPESIIIERSDQIVETKPKLEK